MTPEYSKLRGNIRRKRRLIAKHEQELKALLAQCTHEEVEQKSKYVEGTYLDTAYTRHWEECKLCGQSTEETIENHNYYG